MANGQQEFLNTKVKVCVKRNRKNNLLSIGKAQFLLFSSRFAKVGVNLPDMFVALDVYFMELFFARLAGDVRFHFHGNVTREHRQQQAFLDKTNDSKLMLISNLLSFFNISHHTQIEW